MLYVQDALCRRVHVFMFHTVAQKVRYMRRIGTMVVSVGIFCI